MAGRRCIGTEAALPRQPSSRRQSTSTISYWVSPDDTLSERWISRSEAEPWYLKIGVPLPPPARFFEDASRDRLNNPMQTRCRRQQSDSESGRRLTAEQLASAARGWQPLASPKPLSLQAPGFRLSWHDGPRRLS